MVGTAPPAPARRSPLSWAAVVAGAFLGLAGTAAFLSDALGHGAEPGLDGGDAFAAAIGVVILLLGLYFPGRRPPSPAPVAP